jgi:hypothetical protein
MANAAFLTPRRPVDLDATLHELNNAFGPIIMSVDLLRKKLGALADAAAAEARADAERTRADAQHLLDHMAGNAWRGVTAARRIMLLSESRGGVRRRARKTRPSRK